MKVNGESGEDQVDNGDMDHKPVVPPSLRRKRVHIPGDSGDVIVDTIKNEILSRVDLLKPNKTRSNLSKPERDGLNWILREIKNGELRMYIVQVDKGGAVFVVTKSYILRLVEQKLNDQS